MKNIRKNVYLFFKYVIDWVLSLVLIILLLPLFIIISIAIKIDSKGPVYFKQIRTGKNGKEFILFKFRSMTIDNDVHNFNEENKVTKVGAFLRKTSLDELPQLINIHRGQMSFIGPRPWIPDYYKRFNKTQKRRVNVLPGITGYAQASGRNNLSINDKIKLDVYYVDNFSFLMDLKVLFGTVKAVLTKEGADLSKTGIKDELEELEKTNSYKFDFNHERN